jgi:hypothetical protein
MSEESFYKNLMTLDSGIKVCLEQKLYLPALMLIYSGIDTVGWLDSLERDATKESFIKWSDTYLLKVKSLACSAIELYAARCGLLHTFSADSRLSYKGEARRICYAWGKADVHDLQLTNDLTASTQKYVAVHVNELYEAWHLALVAFTDDLENDTTRKDRVFTKASRFFTDMSMEFVRDAIDMLDSGV